MHLYLTASRETERASDEEMDSVKSRKLEKVPLLRMIPKFPVSAEDNETV